MEKNDMERDAIDLGTVRVATLFRRFFVPTLLGMLSSSAVTVADGMFVGHGVGSDGIATTEHPTPAISPTPWASISSGT